MKITATHIKENTLTGSNPTKIQSIGKLQNRKVISNSPSHWYAGLMFLLLLSGQSIVKAASNAFDGKVVFQDNTESWMNEVVQSTAQTNFNSLSNTSLNHCFPQRLNEIQSIQTKNFVTLEYEEEIKPYVTAVGETLKPDRPTPITEFPALLCSFMYRNLMLVGAGDRGCELIDDLSRFPAICEFTTQKLENHLEEEEKKLQSNRYYFLEKGYKVERSYKDEMMKEPLNVIAHLGLNHQKVLNFWKASKLVEEKMLKGNILEQSPDKILDFIKELYKEILQDLPVISSKANGFRKDSSIVIFDEKFSTNLYHKRFDIIENYLKNDYKFSDEKFNDFKTSFNIVAEIDSSRPFTYERHIWDKLAYFAPHQDKVDQLMLDFTKKLKFYVQRKIHPLALGAWAHAEILRIHPMADGNGRLSRLLLYGLLARGGYLPSLFSKQQAHTHAIIEDDKKRGSFVKYLVESVIPWSRKQYEHINFNDDKGEFIVDQRTMSSKHS